MPSTFSAGTIANPSKTSSEVGDPRMAQFCRAFCAGRNPLNPFSIRKAVMPVRPRIGPGLGIDDQGFGVVAVVIHSLVPLRT